MKPKEKILEKGHGKIQEKMSFPTGTCNGTNQAIYGLGFIGASIHYISTATGFWMGVLGVLKAIVWPAFVVYGLLKQLGM